MKLLLISRDFPNMFGGVSDYTYHLSRALAEKGEEVYVLTSKNEKVIWEDYEVRGKGHIKVLPVMENWGFRGLPGILREVKKINPDWILLQYVPHMYNYYGVPLWVVIFVIWLRLKKLKLTTTFHEVAIRFDIRKPKYWGIAIIQRLIAYTLCICSNKSIVSIEYYRRLLHRFSNKIFKIPIGSSILPFEFDAEEKHKLRSLISSNGEYIITTFSSGASWLRSDLLLKATNIAMGKYALSLKIVFLGKIGNSPQRENIEILAKQLNIENKILMTGFLNSTEIYKYLTISDIYIILDDNAYGGISTKSTSLASAYAAGLPIIGNKGLLTDNFFQDRDNVFLVNSLNPEDIADAIYQTLKDNYLRKLLALKSKEIYKSILSWQSIAQRYLEVLELDLRNQ